jgi:DNA-binding beta-propeller fold protein YncE
MIKRAVVAVAGLGLVLGTGACGTARCAAGPVHAAAEVHLPAGPVTAYVLNQNSGTVTPIHTATNTAGRPIRAGRGFCNAMAISPNGREIYVTNLAAGTVIPISTRTNRAGKAIKVGAGASVVAFTPDGKTAYVITDNSVVPVNVATGTPGRPIRVAPATRRGGSGPSRSPPMARPRTWRT